MSKSLKVTLSRLNKPSSILKATLSQLPEHKPATSDILTRYSWLKDYKHTKPGVPNGFYSLGSGVLQWGDLYLSSSGWERIPRQLEGTVIKEGNKYVRLDTAEHWILICPGENLSEARAIGLPSLDNNIMWENQPPTLSGVLDENNPNYYMRVMTSQEQRVADEEH